MEVVLATAKALLFAMWIGANQPGSAPLTSNQLEAARDIAVACLAYGVDPLVGVSVGWQESKLHQSMRGTKGEIGVMQIYWRGKGYAVNDPSELYVQKHNAREGCARLRAWKTHKKLEVRLHYVAHYNGGSSITDKPAATHYEEAVLQRVLRWLKSTKKVS